MEYDPQGLGEPRWALYGSLESLESNCDRTQIFTFVIFPDLNQKYEWFIQHTLCIFTSADFFFLIECKTLAFIDQKLSVTALDMLWK